MLTYEDFTEVNVSLSVLDEAAPVNIEKYQLELPELEEGEELIYTSDTLIDGTTMYFTVYTGKKDQTVVYGEDGGVEGVNTNYIYYHSFLCSFDIETEEFAILSDNADELYYAADDGLFNTFLLAAQDGYIYYLLTQYEQNELNGYLATGGWIKRLDLSTLENETLCETGERYVFSCDGNIWMYDDKDIYRFDLDTFEWEPTITDYENYGVDPTLSSDERFCVFDNELGFVTYLRKNGDKERTLTTDKYTIKTKLRSGGILSVTENMAIISNASDCTLHVYDIGHMERYSYELSGLGAATQYMGGGESGYTMVNDIPVACGDHVLVYSLVTQANDEHIDDYTAYVDNSYNVTASFMLPEYGVAYRLGGLLIDQENSVFPDVGTVEDKAYIFTGEELMIISEEMSR
ncbi:MAG: hypothetical protein IJM44_03165 [Ruminococcus sp.]|nr:hypothetical protein [Ruminococcus sp.]